MTRPPRPDNYFLFLVEREILEHATKKILSQKKSVPVAQDEAEYLLPIFIPAPEFMDLYHSTEIRLGRIRAFLRHRFCVGVNFVSRAGWLARDGAFMLQALTRYWALRLFAPKTLKRYRERRKALGIPG